jgi:hypothetical protein
MSSVVILGLKANSLAQQEMQRCLPLSVLLQWESLVHNKNTFLMIGIAV